MQDALPKAAGSRVCCMHSTRTVECKLKSEEHCTDLRASLGEVRGALAGGYRFVEKSRGDVSTAPESMLTRPTVAKACHPRSSVIDIDTKVVAEG